MATSLNGIILSCFTAAEWRVKWRIVEDVLVGDYVSQPMVLPMCHREEEEKENEKERRRDSSSSNSSNRPEQRQHHVKEDSWQVNGHEHLARSLVWPAFPRLASLSMSLFPRSLGNGEAGGCWTTHLAPRRRYHGPDMWPACQRLKCVGWRIMRWMTLSREYFLFKNYKLYIHSFFFFFFLNIGTVLFFALYNVQMTSSWRVTRCMRAAPKI